MPGTEGNKARTARARQQATTERDIIQKTDGNTAQRRSHTGNDGKVVNGKGAVGGQATVSLTTRR